MCFVCGRWGQFDKFKQSSNVSKKESIRRILDFGRELFRFSKTLLRVAWHSLYFFLDFYYF